MPRIKEIRNTPPERSKLQQSRDLAHLRKTPEVQESSPDNKVVPRNVKIVCLIMAGSALAAGNPFMLGLLVSLMAPTARADSTNEPPVKEIAPLANPYGNNAHHKEANVIKDPKHYTECKGISNYAYIPNDPPTQANSPEVEQIYCIREVAPANLDNATLNRAVDEAAAIINSDKETKDYSFFNLLTKFPAYNSIRFSILDRAFRLLGLAHGYPESEILAPQGTLTDRPFQFDLVPSQVYLKQAIAAKDSVAIFDLIDHGVYIPLNALDHEQLIKMLFAFIEVNPKSSAHAIDHLLQHPINLNQRVMPLNPLFFSVAQGNKVAVKTLLQHGASMDLTDELGQSPFREALNKGKRDIIRTMIENVKVPTQDPHKRAVEQLMYITQTRDKDLQQDIYQWLVEFQQFDVNTRDAEDNTVYHLALNQATSNETKQEILSVLERLSPALMESKNKQGFTPAQLAQYKVGPFNPLPYLKMFLGFIMLLPFLLLLIRFLVKCFRPSAPKENFTIQGIYCQLQFKEMADYRYKWRFKFLSVNELPSYHEQFPDLYLRFLVSEQTLQNAVEDWLNNSEQGGVYLNSQNKTLLKTFLKRQLARIEANLIEATAEYQQNQGMSKERQKKYTKIDAILNDFLSVTTELRGGKRTISLRSTAFESSVIDHIRKEVEAVSLAENKSFADYEKSFFNLITDLDDQFDPTHNQNYSNTAKLHEQLTKLSHSALNTLHTNMGELTRNRTKFIHETAATIDLLSKRLDEEIIKLRKHSGHNPEKEDGMHILVSSPKLHPVAPPKKVLSKEEKPPVVRPVAVITQLLPSKLSFFSGYTKPTTPTKTKPARVSYKSNELLVQEIERELQEIRKLVSTPNIALEVKEHAIKYHLLQLCQCSILISGEKNEIRICDPNDSSFGDIHSYLALHSHRVDFNDIIETAKDLVATFAGPLSVAKLFTLQGTLLQSRAITILNDKKRYNKLDMSEIRQALLTILDNIDFIEKYRAENHEKETSCQAGFKILLMGFSELVHRLYNDHHYVYRNEILVKMPEFRRIEQELFILKQSVQRPFEPKTPVYSPKDLQCLLEQVLRKKEKLMEIFGSLDQNKPAISLVKR